jgi:tetratricopeptide (TPR) repeat protein
MSIIKIFFFVFLLLGFLCPSWAQERRKPGTYDPLMEEDLKRTIIIEPNSPMNADYFMGLGKRYFGERRYKDAIEAFTKATSLNPSNAEAYFILGKAYREIRRYKDAEVVFKRAILCKPNYTLAYQFLGLIYIDLGRFNDAAPAFIKAAMLDPGWAAFYYYHYENVDRELIMDIAEFRRLVKIIYPLDHNFAKMLWDNFLHSGGKWTQYRNQEKNWPLR